MAAAPRRSDFEDEGTSKPRSRRSYEKSPKDKPFDRGGKDHERPRGRRPFAADDDPDLDDDFEDLEDEDLDLDEEEFDDLEDDDFDNDEWDDMDDDDR